MGNLSPETILESICAQTKTFLNAHHTQEVVIGLSGGIDSSVVASIAVLSLGKERVHGVWLPGPYSSQASEEDAKALADTLQITVRTCSINDSFHAISSAFQAGYDQPLQGLAAENTQARLRMCVLMALSNAFDWMLLNTGNLSEACMGYSTLYGDTCGAYAPIGGLYKTEVYSLARYINTHFERMNLTPPIPERVLTKPPSAELSDGQTDENALGMTYEALDELLTRMIDLGEPYQSIGSEAEHVWKRYQSYAFKRALKPPYPAFERSK